MDMPRGYFTASGYVGFLPDSTKMFFASESDYQDYIGDTESEAA